MFLNDVNKKEEIRLIAIEHLKKSGIKYKAKKVQSHQVQPQVGRCAKKFFKVPLNFLETETVTLGNGQQLKIPKRMHEICLFILTKVQTEGIFRKEGSKMRQVQIKLSLDKGHPLGEDHHVIDVAVVLKSFLRDLPEPLIPPSHKDLFLMCSVGKKPKEHILKCLLLACLLLPAENLNILSYLMQFFNEVATYADSNKMNYGNLSILVGPNIFPIDDKLAPKSSLVITKICDITKLLIENAENIGIIPDFITEQLLCSSSDDTNNIAKKKNKRRSGSLTRMLSGWKKIVSSNKTEEENSTAVHSVQQPIIYTPIIENSTKKRKITRLSLKKKKDNDNFSVPFTPLRTPVSINPKGKKPAEDSDQTSLLDVNKEPKKNHWYMRTRSMKSLLKDEDSSTSSINSSTTSSSSSSRRRSSILLLGQKSLLERRWSAVSNAANFKRKKRTSCSNLSKISANNIVETDYVRVPKTEFEDFKHRVSAIERRISIELDLVQQHDDAATKETTPLKENNIENVQNAYEKALENAPLSPTTDQLARKFTKDLKIRRSLEQKIIRSPSARKIGVIRRRSTERERRNVQIMRNQSWNVSRQKILVAERDEQPKKKQQQKSAENLAEWQNAPGYFSASKTNNIIEDNSTDFNPNRASIVKLRSQNLGMVREKAKLFGELKDADHVDGRKVENSIETPKYVKMLQTDETRAKKSLSPRNRYVNTPQKHKLQQIGRQYVKIQRKSPINAQDSFELRSPRRRILLTDETLTPNNNNNNQKNLPQIKAPLPIKTPKRLCRTPAIIINNNNNRKTPLKAFATPL